MSEAPITPAESVATPEAATEPAAPEQGNREARYRKQLREAEAERDSLRDAVTSFQRSEIERLTDLEKPAAIWATGVTVDELLTDEGQIDSDKVRVAVQVARDELGVRPPARAPQPNPAQGAGGNGQGGSNPWVDAFKH